MLSHSPPAAAAVPGGLLVRALPSSLSCPSCDSRSLTRSRSRSVRVTRSIAAKRRMKGERRGKKGSSRSGQAKKVFISFIVRLKHLCPFPPRSWTRACLGYKAVVWVQHNTCDDGEEESGLEHQIQRTTTMVSERPLFSHTHTHPVTRCRERIPRFPVAHQTNLSKLPFTWCVCVCVH